MKNEKVFEKSWSFQNQINFLFYIPWNAQIVLTVITFKITIKNHFSNQQIAYFDKSDINLK